MKSFLLILLALSMPINAGSTEAPVILVLGDSLSAAYGIDRDKGWVNLLRQRLVTRSHPHRVVNASISGDTTAGGLNRLPGALKKYQPSILVLELGSNDGLRGLDFGATRANLKGMVELARSQGCRVLLVGMRMPPNFGKVFTERFQRLFSDLAEEMSLPLVPFLLRHVVDEPAWMQADNLHPTADAQPTMLENVWPHLESLLADPDQSAITSK